MNLPKVFSEIEFSKSQQKGKHLSLPIMTDPRQGSAKPGGGAAFPMGQAEFFLSGTFQRWSGNGKHKSEFDY